LTLKNKSDSSIKLAYRFEKEGELNLAANRFYYSVLQKTLSYAEENGYNYSQLTKEEKKESHNSLIGYINKLISEERKRNPHNKKLNDLNSFQFDFNSIKKVRIKADYKNEDVTIDDINHLKNKLDDFNDKYSLLKQM